MESEEKEKGCKKYYGGPAAAQNTGNMRKKRAKAPNKNACPLVGLVNTC